MKTLDVPRDELPKPEQLRVKIVEEHNSRGNTEVVNIEGAMYVNRYVEPKKGQKSGDKKFKYKCFKCHKLGHKASECKKKESISETRFVESCANEKILKL